MSERGYSGRSAASRRFVRSARPVGMAPFRAARSRTEKASLSAAPKASLSPVSDASRAARTAERDSERVARWRPRRLSD